MFVVGLLSWWYGAGWKARFAMVRERLASSADYFSIDLLLKTLFSPYRQIAAGRVEGPIAVKWHAFLDRLISRVIGAFVRFFIIIIGIIVMSAYAILGGISLILWFFVPLFPVIGIIFALIGWTPQWM